MGLGDLWDDAKDLAGDVTELGGDVLETAGDVATAPLDLAEGGAKLLAKGTSSLARSIFGDDDDDAREEAQREQQQAVDTGESERTQIAGEREALQSQQGATATYDIPRVGLFPGGDEDFEQWSHQAIKDMLDGIDTGGISAAAQEVSDVAGALREDLSALRGDLTSIIGGGWEGRAADSANRATDAHLTAAGQLAASIDEVGLALRQTASVATQAQQSVGDPQPFDASSVFGSLLDPTSLLTSFSPFGGLGGDLFGKWQAEKEAHEHAVQVATTWREGYHEVSGLVPVLQAPPSPVVGVPTPNTPPTPPQVEPGRPPQVHPDQTEKPTPVVPQSHDGQVEPPPTQVVPQQQPPGTPPPTTQPQGVDPGSLGQVGRGPGSQGSIGQGVPGKPGSGPGSTDGHHGSCCCDCCCSDDDSATDRPGSTTPAGTSAAALTGLGAGQGTGATSPFAAGSLGGAVPSAVQPSSSFEPTLAGLLGRTPTGGGAGVGAAGAGGAPSAASLLRQAGIGGPVTGSTTAAGGKPTGGFGPLGSSSGTFGTPVSSPSSSPSAHGAPSGLRDTSSPGMAAGSSAHPVAGSAPAPAQGGDGGRPAMGGMPMMGGAGGRGSGGGNGEHRRPDYLVTPEHSAELVGDMPLVAPPVIGGR